MHRGYRGSGLRLRRLLAVGGTTLLLSSLLLTTSVATAVAADTSVRHAGSQTGQAEWTTGANALGAPDGASMTATGTDIDQGFGGFGIDLPAGSVIDGITVNVTAASTDSSGCQLSVRLSGNGGSGWTARKTVNLNASLTARTFGSTSDTWGWDDPDWDPASLDDGSFRLEVRNVDPGANCSGTTSVDAIGVVVTYRTMAAGTANDRISREVCDQADFNFVIDMSGSIGVQGGAPSNLPDMQAGISAFVASFQAGGGSGLYSGTRFSGSSATALTSGYDSAAAFLQDVDDLSGPSGTTPTAQGIATGAANDSGDRAGVPNILFVITDGSPNVPTGGTGTGSPNTWITAANAAIAAANDARDQYIVKAVYLSTAGDPGDTGLPFSADGDAQWAAKVMTEIGGGSYLPADFSSFVTELYEAIGCPPPAPEVEVTKTADPTSVPEPGDDVEFTVTVHNLTAKAVTLDTLVDDVYGDLDGVGSCDTGISLDPGQVYECSFTKAVTGNAGDEHHDTVTAAIHNADGKAEDSDDATVDITDVEPSVTIVKTATPGSRPEPGGLFTYTLEITNTSPEDVTITALDDDQVDLSAACLALIGDTLTPGQTVSCQFTATHSAVDTYTNVASVTVEDDEGNTGGDDDDATVEVIDVPPTVTLDKSVDDDSKPEPGGTFTYTLKVTNTSAEPVTITALTDDHALSASCLGLIDDVLAPGASASCTYQVAYSDAGSYPNTAAVTVEDDEGSEAGDEDDVTVTVVDVLPTVTLDKVVVGTATRPEPGGTFTYRLTITNTSVETVTIDELTDTNALSQACLDLIGDTLAPGASVSCEYGVARSEPGTYPNTATVTVSDDEEHEASDSDDATVQVTDVPPVVELTKSVDDDSKPEPGGTFTFTLTIQNLSNEAVTITDLTDSQALSQDCLDLIGEVLAPAGQAGSSVSCTYEVDHAVPGTYPNTATVTVEDDDGSEDEDEDDETVVVVDVDPTVQVVKSATPSSRPEPGGTFTYTVEVTNDSDETVWLTELIDTKFGDLDGQGTCVADGSVQIAVGDTYTCTFDAEVTGNAGFEHQNTVVATVVDDEGSEAQNLDDEVVSITDVPPNIIVDKLVDPETVYPGQTVTFSIAVVNDSDEAVTLTSLVDSIYGDLDGMGTCAVPQQLAANAIYRCEFDAVITETETDVVTAIAVDDDGSSDQDDDDATVTVLPVALDIEKSNDAPLETIELPDGSTVDLPTAEVGSTVTYTLAFTVTPDAGVRGATITDVLPAGLDYVDGSATSTDQMVFQGYDAATRTLSWLAETLDASGQVTYQVIVAAGADELAQPLENLAVIDSDQTEPEDDESEVFVPTVPAAATSKPTLPPTDAAAPTTPASAGTGLPMVLAVLAGLVMLALALVPAPIARRAIGPKGGRTR